jgi:hypothetical protein
LNWSSQFPRCLKVCSALAASKPFFSLGIAFCAGSFTLAGVMMLFLPKTDG